MANVYIIKATTIPTDNKYHNNISCSESIKIGRSCSTVPSSIYTVLCHINWTRITLSRGVKRLSQNYSHCYVVQPNVFHT